MQGGQLAWMETVSQGTLFLAEEYVPLHERGTQGEYY